MDSAPFADRRLHFVGIGGAGMSGLALVAQELGATVSGSDRSESPYVERLREEGLSPSIGHDAANLPEDAEVVVSTAIPETNPELARARELGSKVVHRGRLLGELSTLKRCIAVSGTHGKTTTAAMIAQILLASDAHPAYVIGGELRSTGRNAHWGRGDWIVVEADESDRSFLEIDRDVIVVTNLELDHHATYRSLSELRAAFAEFAEPAETRIYGSASGLPGPALHYSLHPPADIRAEALDLADGGARFTVDGVEVRLSVPGAHNASNALGALVACREAGVALADAAPALEGFAGTARRFEPRGRTRGGAALYDDYAHHPTEVAATLAAARTLEPARLVACFQPHLFSRTREFAREFGEALALADLIVVTDVYPARERSEDFPGVSGLTIARAAATAAGGRPVWWLPTLDQAAQRLGDELGDGDVLLTLGAGDVDRVATALELAGEGPDSSPVGATDG